MKMAKYFICCEQCLENIARNSTNAARIWMDLCAINVKKGNPFPLLTIDFPELRALEQMGFIVTTDQNGKLMIRLNGRCLTDDGYDFFCLRHGDHD